LNRHQLVAQYLQALDLADPAHDLVFLAELNRRHVATFPFSSVGVRLGDELPLDFASLHDRIVARRRGGYCFEQNGLMFGVLDELGFAPEMYLARVIYNEDVHPGLTHRVTLIEQDGEKYLLDVGFGPDGPRVPVTMEGRETQDGAKVYRVKEKQPGQFHLQVLKDGDFFSLYRFELAQYGEADCEVGHFYSHKSPKASFVNHLVVSRILDQETRSLRDLDYRVMKEEGDREQTVGDAAHLHRILVDDLNIRVSDNESERLFRDLASRDAETGA
jgi:N-hydroxyarylamine O-acetyltransferase